MNNYNKMLLVAESNGLTSGDLDRAMLNVAGTYSNMTDNEIRTIIQPQIDSICEPIYEKDGVNAFNECTKKLVDDYRLKELRKSRSKNFWSGVGSFLDGINKSKRKKNTIPLDSKFDDYVAGNEPRIKVKPKDDKKDNILGMKPLTFTLVSILTATVLTVGIVYLVRKK